MHEIRHQVRGDGLYLPTSTVGLRMVVQDALYERERHEASIRLVQTTSDHKDLRVVVEYIAGDYQRIAAWRLLLDSPSRKDLECVALFAEGMPRAWAFQILAIMSDIGTFRKD